MERKATVLVVDDETDMRICLAKLLVRAGYNVLTARDGEEALHTLEQLGPADLIVLDLMMPNMDGLETMARLRGTRFRNTPVLVLTAKADPLDIQLGYLKGADVYLTKPFEQEALLRAIQRLIGQEDAKDIDPNPERENAPAASV